MEELLATNNIVTLSYVEALLKDSEIEYLLVDWNMSVLEGSIGVIPRRVLVQDSDINKARRLITDAGLGHELKNQQG